MGEGTTLAAVGSLWGYAVAGYVLTAVAILGYVGSLFGRARRARLRVAAIAYRRGRPVGR